MMAFPAQNRSSVSRDDHRSSMLSHLARRFFVVLTPRQGCSVPCRIATPSMPTRNVLTEKLSTEEEVELGLIVRAMQDLCEVLDLPKSSSSLVSALVERLVG